MCTHVAKRLRLSYNIIKSKYERVQRVPYNNSELYFITIYI